jgi:hypothetical protein
MIQAGAIGHIDNGTSEPEIIQAITQASRSQPQPAAASRSQDTLASDREHRDGW